MPAKKTSPTSPNTAISFHQNNQRHAARYVSGTTVFEEVLDNTRLTGIYWTSAGQIQRENILAKLPDLNTLEVPMHSFELNIDGQSLHNRWDWTSATTRPGPRTGTTEAVITLTHQVRPVTLKVVTRLDGSPILTRHLEITNTAKQPAALSSIAPWSGLLWNTHTAHGIFNQNPSFNERTTDKFILGHLVGEKIGYEGDFVWTPIPKETYGVERTYKGSSYASPYYIIKNAVTGEMFFLGIEWSANFFLHFNNRKDDLLMFRTGPLAPGPQRVIDPGETVTSPAIHLGPMRCNLDEAVGQWHQHMRTSVLPARPKGKEIITIAGRVVEEPNDWILKEADIAAEMGVECFLVDAGWYGNDFSAWSKLRGDWNVGKWMPGGLKGIRDRCHKLGLMFGLWHDAEAMTHETETFKKHPDWLLRTDGKRGVDPYGCIDLSNPEAAKYYEDMVLNIFREHKPDMYKLDYNVEAYEGGQRERHGFLENEYWRHFEVVYRVYDRVRKEFPNVILENCAGGGARNDIGMLSRFHICSASDWSIFPYGLRMLNTMTLFIPPEAIAYYHNHISSHSHLTCDIDTHLRVMLFGVPIIVGFGGQNADRSMDYYVKTQRYIELHKTTCRPVLAGHPIAYHHTPDIGLLQPAEWCVLEYGIADHSQGYAGVFRLSDGPKDYLLKLRGVDRGTNYRVSLDNSGQSFVASGQELANTGLTIRLDSALTSELVFYKKTK